MIREREAVCGIIGKISRRAFGNIGAVEVHEIPGRDRAAGLFKVQAGYGDVSFPQIFRNSPEIVFVD